MTHSKRIQTLFINPVVLALFTSSAGFAASEMTAASTDRSPASEVAGEVVLHDSQVVMAEGTLLIEEPEAVLTEGELVIEASTQSDDLAARMIDALSIPSAPRTGPARRAAHRAQATSKTWSCGKWEELWQGRGRGRTCEWK